MGIAEPAFYLQLIQHDSDVLATLSAAASSKTPPLDVSDWKCTLLFYMARIYMKALGRARGRDLQDHYGIKQWINTDAALVAIARSYRKLEERSRNARYEGRRYSRPELDQACRWFSEVRDHVSNLLKRDGIQDMPVIDPQPFL
jgi:hypothetical protein